MRVENIWMHGGGVILKFEGVDTISAAEKLAGAEVCIPREQRPAPPAGEYYQSDLIGCEVVDKAGAKIGSVTGWQDFGGPALLEVDAGGREVLIPFVRSICTHIDPVARRIVVQAPEGLLDLNPE